MSFKKIAILILPFVICFKIVLAIETNDMKVNESLGFQLELGGLQAINSLNISNILVQNGYEKSNSLYLSYGLGIYYKLGNNIEFGINGQLANTVFNMSSHSTLMSSDIRITYKFQKKNTVSFAPFIGFGVKMQNFTATKKNIYIPDLDSLFLYPNAVQLTNGWITPTIGIDFLKKVNNSNNSEYGFSVGYQFGISKQPWGIENKNFNQSVSDYFHSFFISLKIKNCFL